MRIKDIAVLALPLAVLATAGCEDTVSVITPNVVEASSIDPLADAATFARSAVQNMYTALPHAVIVYGAWFTNEMRVGDTFPTRNEFGRRIIDDSNTTLNGDVWVPLSRAVASAENTIDLLRDVNPTTNINLQRGYFAGGFSLLFMAETFCQGVMRVGAPMTPAQTLDSAVVRFQRAIDIGVANGTADAVAMANASRVGLARAYLQLGRNADAAAAAAQVPAGFSFNAIYADDASNRFRLGNGVYYYSLGGLRESLVTGPEWRAISDAGDDRITYADGMKDAQDGVHRLFTQRKYQAWNSTIRLASKLEADYIAAEAGGTADQLALIQLRRTAAGQPAFAGGTPAEVLAELMYQKSIDFWLEGKRMGDFQRNGNAVPFIIQPGDNYYKPELGEVSNQTCFPVPRIEKDNNEHF